MRWGWCDMSLTRRQPTPVPIRHIPRWQAVPRSGMWFAPHQELVGCLPALVVYAGGLVGLLGILWAIAAGGRAGAP